MYALTCFEALIKHPRVNHFAKYSVVIFRDPLHSSRCLLVPRLLASSDLCARAHFAQIYWTAHSPPVSSSRSCAASLPACREFGLAQQPGVGRLVVGSARRALHVDLHAALQVHPGAAHGQRDWRADRPGPAARRRAERACGDSRRRTSALAGQSLRISRFLMRRFFLTFCACLSALVRACLLVHASQETDGWKVDDLGDLALPNLRALCFVIC